MKIGRVRDLWAFLLIFFGTLALDCVLLPLALGGPVLKEEPFAVQVLFTFGLVIAVWGGVFFAASGIVPGDGCASKYECLRSVFETYSGPKLLLGGELMLLSVMLGKYLGPITIPGFVFLLLGVSTHSSAGFGIVLALCRHKGPDRTEVGFFLLGTALAVAAVPGVVGG